LSQYFVVIHQNIDYSTDMKTSNSYKVEIEEFKALLLNMASEKSIFALLNLIVQKLGDFQHIALARIWLIKPGDICEECHMAKECLDRTECLHLVASAGGSAIKPYQEWNGINGFFRRFPIGVRKVGKIAKTGKPFEVIHIKGDSEWIANLDWVKQEGIVSYSGQPLIANGKVLGVLSIFSRVTLDSEIVPWLRLIANHSAISIINARTFEDNNALRKRLNLENSFLKEELEELQSFGGIIGQSDSIKNIIKKINLVAPTTAGVLIVGESGTGKELIAREIHKQSLQKKQAMIKVNCASIPNDLYESEFFGHAKGAFTGAIKTRAGRFQAAHNGTLFLDEVAEIPISLQSKLLRVLQEGEYERVGEERTRKVNVRIISATNRDLKKEIISKRFREDLFYRLNVFPIEVPPLRSRIDDIPLLADHILNAITLRKNRPRLRLTKKNIKDLQGYHWPGNVRELQNILERAVILSESNRLFFDIPGKNTKEREGVSKAVDTHMLKTEDILTEEQIRAMEQLNTRRALEKCNWQIYGQRGAAIMIGIKPTTLIARMKKMGLQKTFDIT